MASSKKPAVQDQDEAFARLLASYSADVQKLYEAIRKLGHKLVPGALEETDVPAKMLALTFIPRTYKGMIIGIALQKTYVNINFGRGVELQPFDPKGLLEGTGKFARHIKIRTPEQIRDPAVATLIKEAAARAARSR